MERAQAGEGQLSTDQPPGRIKDVRVLRNSFIGLAVLFCSLFLIFGTWPLYGAAGAVPQFVIWAVAFVLACRSFMTSPTRVLLLSLVPLVVYGVFVVLWRT